MLRLPWSKQGAIAPTPVVSLAPGKLEGPPRKLSRINYSNDEALKLELKPGMFRLVWVLVITAHMLCAMFLLIFAATYYYLTDPIMGYYVHLWAPETGNLHYELYAMVCASIYFLHLSRMLQLGYYSIRECRLSFKRSKKPTITHIENIATKPAKAGSSYQQQRRDYIMEYRHHIALLVRPAKEAWAALFSQVGLFGVENQHFLTVFIVRELLELSTQTYQAYQFSRFLPRAWLSTLLVSMLLINCWSTLAVQHFLGNKPALERVVALSADAAICMAMSVVVPCLLVAPYANSMDTANSSFKDPDQLYDPVFITRLVLGFQLTFASGLKDFAAKVIPQLALYMALVTIGSLITRPPKQIPVAITTTEQPPRWADDVSFSSYEKPLVGSQTATANSSVETKANYERLAPWKQ
ncbi:unnamed protein product [Phytophthora lilii]|uniref:Unnamed protein product n=1 Tax=Phytophthora lilii TaxID=2077276 RepID=A0A9W6X0T0_9STRA|nr:unnamed protein product [Phytophthora lilii]